MYTCVCVCEREREREREREKPRPYLAIVSFCQKENDTTINSRMMTQKVEDATCTQ